MFKAVAGQQFRQTFALQTTRNTGYKQFQILKLPKFRNGKNLPDQSESGALRTLKFLTALWVCCQIFSLRDLLGDGEGVQEENVL